MKHISEYIVNMLENYAQKIVAALDGLLSFFLLSWRFCTVFKNPRKCLIFVPKIIINQNSNIGIEFLIFAQKIQNSTF